MPFYAHSNDQDKTQWQTVCEHLENAADLARRLGEDSGVSEFAYAAALLHDIGKYSPDFQKRLEGSTQRVDHSTAGAKEIDHLFSGHPVRKIYGRMLAYCIAGHHGGLPDAGMPADLDSDSTLEARLKRETKDYSRYTAEIDTSRLALPDRILIKPVDAKTVGFSLSFFTRMIYSTLVDADFIETETFMNGGSKPRGNYETIAALASRFADYLHRFDHPEGPVNQRRNETLQMCIRKASLPPGLFTLTLPTGAGKTFASMAFALEHALRYGLKRIIYVIPYTSIIEQNAGVFKESLGDFKDHVLEHHSNLDWSPAQEKQNIDSEAPDNTLQKLKLATENWDIPIVVTTSVQFFESLFSNRSSRNRKVHNLAKSVILFDEAQMLPRDYMKPCLYSVAELVKNYGASAVFCTATQPCIEKFLPAGSELRELIDNPQEQFNFYKRVRVLKKGRLTDEALLEQIGQQQQALCIVNTRKHARDLFQGLPEEGRFHLSTLMCATHRRAVIAEIRRRLKKGLSCRVISTQLLEAGVDLDFPIGYRALAGLESIVQSAGRVNREGERPSGELFVFEPISESTRPLPAYIRQAADVARLILDQYDDPVCIEAVQAYYRQVYGLHNPSAFDSRNIMECFEKGINPPAFDFQTASERFKFIEQNTTAVLITYDTTARSLLEQLCTTQYPLSVLRKLQPYSVNIFEPEYQALINTGAIDVYADKYPVLNQPDLYDKHTGLALLENRGGQGIFL